jgi:hypothetical protein
MIREATKEDTIFLKAILGEDPTPLMERAMVLVDDYGGIFFDPVTPNFSIVEAHFVFHKKGRGKIALRACKQALDFCWNNGVIIVLGRIPVEDRPAKLMARWAGLKSIGFGTREDGVYVEYFEIRRAECLPLQQ